MAVLPRPGARLRSVTCETEVVVVKSPVEEIDLRCGGAPMVAVEDDAASTGPPVPRFDTGTLMGKRYVAENESVELLCTKPGAGALSIGDVPLAIKGAKPLPSSD